MTHLTAAEKQWLHSINQHTFTPPPPPQLDPSEVKARIISMIADGKSLDALWGIAIDQTDHSDTRALHLIYPAHSTEERIIFVLDTVTHMHKHNLSPLLLHRIELDGRPLHAGVFHVPADIVSTAGILRTTQPELDSISERSQWRELFSKTEPLHESGQKIPAHAITSVIEAERSALRLLPASTPAPHLSHTSCTFPHCSEPIRLSLYTPKAPEQLLIVLDGDRYRENGLLEDLQKSDFFDTTAVLFIETASHSDRAELFTKRDVFANFLQHHALPWVQELVPLPDAARRIIAGGSFGGLAAAELCRHYPDLARCATTQSASWWWNGLSDDVLEGTLLVDWKKTEAPSDIDVFVEVGCYEGYLLSWNRAFREVLAEQGIRHTYREYSGGHDYACWSRGIIDSLRYFSRS
ncbi:alpha/beta hydrolase [Rothia terrae]|uniref:alpha/beta hydrolase n=1 Tax=Rothia terrae TaxID=396015 RepID=UPI00340C6462